MFNYLGQIRIGNDCWNFNSYKSYDDLLKQINHKLLEIHKATSKE